MIFFIIHLNLHFRFSFGDSTPFFALVGVSLASGSGVLTKNDELEGVCGEIRVIIIKFNYIIIKLIKINHFRQQLLDFRPN